MLLHVFLNNLVLKMLALIKEERLWLNELTEHIVKSLNDV